MHERLLTAGNRGAAWDHALFARLDGRVDIDAGEVGGKGAWLHRLARADLPVVAAYALTTAAYRAVAADAHLSALLDELRTTDPVPERSDIDRERVDAAFLDVELSDEVRRAVTDAFDMVSEGGHQLVAVRSSATAEDLHGSSFAGQYRSFLNVDEAGIERAVRLVWASLWHPAPRWYRHYHGIDETQLGMAVIMMPMVDAVVAGVAFSIDPAGDDDHLRIEVVDGLGEQLVSGAVTPGVHLVPRDRDPREPLADDPDGTIARVASLTSAVEQAFGEPQDLEWAVADRRLFVLQARPITRVSRRPDDGFDDVPSTEEWTTAGIAEMLPGPLAPLVWQTNRLLVEEGFRRLFDELGSLPSAIDQPAGFLARYRGRAALNLDLLAAASGSTADRREIERQYFGTPTTSTPARPSMRARIAAWRRGRRMEKLRHHALVEAAIVTEAIDEVCNATTDAEELSTQSDEWVLHRRDQLLDLAGRAMAAEIAVATCAVASFRRLELSIGRRLGADEGARWAGRLAATPRLPPPHPDASSAVFAGPRWCDTRDAAVLVDTEGERGATDRTEPPSPDPSWIELVHLLQQSPGWTTTRMLTGQILDVRLAVLRRLAEEATELLAQRELTKRSALRLGGHLRALHLELGGRLVDRRLLEHREDVDHLSVDELRGRASMPSRAEVAWRRRWLEDPHATMPLPIRFRGVPSVEQPAGVAEAGDRWVGWAASGGRCTGRAVVLDRPSASGLERGDVLVARNTDASWMPIFSRAGAVVIEEGGPLSHAAIVARELGLPAVLNLPGIVARLSGASSTWVTVDGDAGTVELVDGGARDAT